MNVFFISFAICLAVRFVLYLICAWFIHNRTEEQLKMSTKFKLFALAYIVSVMAIGLNGTLICAFAIKTYLL